jgi:hypothetical protein
MLLKKEPYNKQVLQERALLREEEQKQLQKTLALPDLAWPFLLSVKGFCKNTQAALVDTFTLSIHGPWDMLKSSSTQEVIYIHRKNIQKALENRYWKPGIKIETADYTFHISPEDNNYKSVEELYAIFMIPWFREKIFQPMIDSLRKIRRNSNIISRKTV